MKKMFVALMCVAVLLALTSCSAGMGGTTATDGATQPDALTLIGSFIPFVLIIVVFYFFMLRPQKKQEKEFADMRDSLALGDIIITKGGIVGRIVRIKDDMMLIETGGNKTRLQIQKSAVSEIKAKANVPADEDK